MAVKVSPAGRPPAAYQRVLRLSNWILAGLILPALWTYPTSSWPRGETVVDFHSLALPPDLPNGSYVVQVGRYEEATMGRLTVESGEAPGADRIVLAHFTLDTYGGGRID